MMKKKKRNESPSSRRMGFFSGLACGLFVAFLVYLWSSVLPHPLSIVRTVKQQLLGLGSDEYLKPQTSSIVDEKPHPTFYQFLPGDKIPIPILSSEKSKNEESVPDGVFLQVGSFTTFEDADRQKAKLALLGVIATIETSKGRDNALWYRVRIGPMSKEIARSLKKRLIKEKFDVLVLLIDS